MKKLFLFFLILIGCEKNNPDKISKIDCITQIAIDEISESCKLCKSKYDEFKREDKEDLWEYYIQHKEEVCFPEKSFKVKETFEEKDMFQSEVNSRSERIDFSIDMEYHDRDMNISFDEDKDTDDPNYWGELQDLDEDGVYDINDNCGVIYNPNQENADGDAFGDACDLDIDADGIFNEYDNCPYIPNTNQLDTDNDSIGDVCDEIDNSYMPIEENDQTNSEIDNVSRGSCEDPVVINEFNATYTANPNQLRSNLSFYSNCNDSYNLNNYLLYTEFGSEIVFKITSDINRRIKITIDDKSVIKNFLSLYRINSCNETTIETEESLCSQYNRYNFKQLILEINENEDIYLVLDSNINIVGIYELVNITDNPDAGFSIFVEDISD